MKKWNFVSRLSGSENHKGFSLYDDLGDRVGEIYPLTQDGSEGKKVAQKIVDSLNSIPSLIKERNKLLGVIEMKKKAKAHRKKME